jgi:hypothetical protein
MEAICYEVVHNGSKGVRVTYFQGGRRSLTEVNLTPLSDPPYHESPLRLPDVGQRRPAV